MRKILVSAAAVAAVATAAPAFAQGAGPTASDSANASATIVQPISISKTQDMAFGSIAADSTNPGTVSVAANGTLTSSPNLSITGSTGSAAAFDVDGQATLTYTVQTPANAVLSNGTESMTVTLTGPTGALTIDNGNLNDVVVTGSLAVGANQAPGVYNGSFTVSVQYQ